MLWPSAMQATQRRTPSDRLAGSCKIRRSGRRGSLSPSPEQVLIGHVVGVIRSRHRDGVADAIKTISGVIEAVTY